MEVWHHKRNKTGVVVLNVHVHDFISSETLLRVCVIVQPANPLDREQKTLPP
jgi:hypothetical protein